MLFFKLITLFFSINDPETYNWTASSKCAALQAKPRGDFLIR